MNALSMTDVCLLEGFSPFEFANSQGPVVKMKVSYVVFIFKAFPNTRHPAQSQLLTICFWMSVTSISS